MNSGISKGLDTDEIARLRREAGQWLRSLRLAAGFTQRELAVEVGLEYYTFVSQIESGRGRVPPAHMYAWAEALDVPPRDFALQLLKYYDPLSYRLIYEGSRESKPAPNDNALEARIERLEKWVDKEKTKPE